MDEAKVAIYIRLSLADEDTGYSKLESNSIVHQRMLINDFLNRHAELKDAPRMEFVDDGFTGTNTDRPGFQAAMMALRTGKANVLVTKDFSRAMRDYTEMGNYLECVFPFLGVRYISVNDGYDSKDYKGMTSGMDVVLRNIVYAAYSKDISVKVTTAQQQMMKQGKRFVGAPPYGYRKHPTERYKLAIDPEAAAVVRKVFDLLFAGKSTAEIARILNEEQVPTPGAYFRQKHPGQNCFKKKNDGNGWGLAAVLSIIHRYEYTGAVVGGKRRTAGIGTGKTVLVPVEDRHIVKGMHEAIITEEEFERAQELLRRRDKKKTPSPRATYPLKGLVRCGVCKRVLTLKPQGYFVCRTSYTTPDSKCSTHNHFPMDMLETVSLNAIQQVLSLYQKSELDRENSMLMGRSRRELCMSEMRKLSQQLARLRQEKLQQYERYIAGDVSKESYLKHKKELDEQAAQAQEQLNQQEKTLAEMEQELPPESPVKKLNAAYGAGKELTYEMAHALIQAVYVYPDSQVEIQWKFKDCFEELLAQQQ